MAEKNKPTVEAEEGIIDEAAEATETQNTAETEEASNTEEAVETADADEVIEEGDEKKEGLFKKKNKKNKEQEMIEELNDKLKRQMAEFDNFRKRTEKEKSQMYEIGAKSIVEKVLPVVDNFERGLQALSEEELQEPFAAGMDKIYKQMLSMLEEAGVTPIEAVGKEFDPNLHNAVMHVDDENLGENVVAMEMQKGYMYRDSVVRHSMVQVAN